jgi:hypothetical protein
MYEEDERLPFIIVSPLSQSSPGLKGGRETPVSGSTIFAWQFDISFPVAPMTSLSLGPTVANIRAVVSVSPYPFMSLRLINN